MPLSKADREQFLAEPHIGALAVQEAPDRAPLVVPIWYDYVPGGELLILTEPDSRKGRAIKAAGRFSLMVDRTTPTVRYVSVEGPVTHIERGSREYTYNMARRYLPADKAAEYTEFELSTMGEHAAFYLRPEHWISSDLG
jgi:pyridoxamine 5'-phosphate oxidase-like protein